MPRKASASSSRKKRASKRIETVEVAEPRMELKNVLLSQMPTDPPADLPAEPEEPAAPASSMDPEPEPEAEPETAPQTTVTSCANCAHLPMSVNATVALLVALVFGMSTLVVAASFVLQNQNFQIEAYHATSRTL
jgi:hypothetical protein